ncbi:hypothetical protein Mapa_017744 [Marchantia paleacea]|nr:hypothetical protein Mapa_017744 [Marchantia paleacea]
MYIFVINLAMFITIFAGILSMGWLYLIHRLSWSSLLFCPSKTFPKTLLVSIEESKRIPHVPGEHLCSDSKSMPPIVDARPS